MSFEADVRAFGEKALANARGVFERTVDLAFESVVEGSPATGAPGQPVVSGRLKKSWRKEVTGDDAAIYTTLHYAPFIEDQVRGTRPTNDPPTPGGPHGVKLTVAGMDRLVAQAVAEVVGA